MTNAFGSWRPLQSPGEWPAAVRELVASREADAAEAAAAELRRDAEAAEEAAEAEAERLRQAAARAQHSARQAEAARRVPCFDKGARKATE
jgi:hypothetical protein